jgi:hypothetical protein
MLRRATAQAVSHWLPTAISRVRAWVWLSGSVAGADFHRVLRYPLPIFIPPNSPSSQSAEGRYDRPYVVDVASGPSMDSTPHYANLKKKRILSTEVFNCGDTMVLDSAFYPKMKIPLCIVLYNNTPRFYRPYACYLQ